MQIPDKTSLELEIAELTRLLEEYRSKITHGTSSTDNFMPITEMEEALGTLRNSTNNIYTKLQSRLVSQLNQAELVRKKKRTTGTKK